MQSTRFLAANMLRQHAAATNSFRTRASTVMRLQQTTRGVRMQATPRMRMPMPKEEHSAHTISQRIRTLKKVPPELIPLGVVLAAALIAAGYSLGRKLYTDQTLRLYRQGPEKGH